MDPSKQPLISSSDAVVVAVEDNEISNDNAKEEILDLPEEREETETDRKKRLATELQARVAEYGGAVKMRSFFKTASRAETTIFFLGCIGAAGAGVGQVALCIFLGDMIDASVDPSPDQVMRSMEKVSAKMAFIGVGVAVLASLQEFGFAYFVQRQQMKIRTEYFDAALHRDVGWFDTHNAGSIPTEMAEEIDKLGEGLGTKFGTSIMSLFQFFGGFAFAFFYSWRLTLVMMASVPFMMIGIVIMGSAVAEASQEKQTAYSLAAAVVEECLYAIRTVVSFGGEKRELMRYGNAVELARQGGLKNSVRAGIGVG
jgi:ABC-type multidrug transport system fused ATPase/permease subunit